MASQVKTPNPSVQASASVRQAAKVKDYVNQQLEKTRKQVKTIDLIASVLLMVASVMAFLLVAALVDGWIWPLSSLGRWVCLGLIVFGCIGYSIFAIVPLFLKKINPDYAAKMIEDAKPSFRNSLMNYVSFRKRPDEIKPAVFDAVSRQAAADLATVPSDASVDQSKLIRLGFVLIGLTVFAVGYKMLSPKDPLQTVARILAPPAKIAKPAVVKIEDVQPGDTQVFFGQPLNVTAVVRGRHRSEDVRLVYSTLDGQLTDQSIAMNPDGAPNHYRGELSMAAGGIQSSLTYRVEARDGISPDYEVTVRPNPSMAIESLVLTPPAYTKLAERTLSGVGDIDAIEGTKATIYARANLPIKIAYIELLNEIVNPNQLGESNYDNRYKVVANPINMQSEGQSAVARFTVALDPSRTKPFATHYRIRFVSSTDDRNSQPNVYPIRVIPDLDPEIKIRNPIQVNSDVPINGVLAIDVRASDLDFTISWVKLTMEHKGNKLLDQRLQLFSSDGNRRVNAGYRFRPGDFVGLDVGDRVVFYATAADNRVSHSSGQPDPNTSSTPPYSVTINDFDQNAKDENPAQEDPNQQPPDEPEQPNENTKDDPADKKEPSENPEPGEEEPSESDPQDSGESGKEKGDEGTEGDEGGSGSENSGREGEEGTEGDPNSSEQGGAGTEGNPDSQPEDAQPKEPGDNNEGGGSGSQPDEAMDPSDPSNQGGQSDNPNGESNPSSNDSGNPGGAQNNQGNKPGDQDAADGNQSNQDPGDGKNPGGAEGKQDDSLTKGATEKSKDIPDGQRMKDLQEHFDNEGSPEPSGKENQPEQNAGDSPEKNSGDDPKSDDPNSDPNRDPTGDNQDPNGSPDGNADGAPTDPKTGEPQSGDPKTGDPQDADAGQQPQQPKPGENEKPEPGDDGPDAGDRSEANNQDGNPTSSDGKEKGSQGETPDGPQTEKNKTAEDSNNNDAAREQSEKPGMEDATGKQSQDPGGEETNKTGNESGGTDPGDSNSKGNESGNNESDKPGDSGKPKPGESGAEGGQEPGQPGEGSKPGEGEQPGEGDQPGKQGNQQDNNKPGGEKPDSQDPNAQAEGKQPNQEEGGAGKEGEQPAQAGEAKESESGGGKKPDSQGDQKSGGSSQPGESQGGDMKSEAADGGSGKGTGGDGSEALERDEINRDHAKKTTDMVLKKLSEQRYDPDPELLKKMNWTKEDMQTFLKRWEEMKNAADLGTPKDKKKYERSLKSLNLRPQGGRRAARESKESVGGLSEDGAVNRPSPEREPDFNSFLRDLNRADDN